MKLGLCRSSFSGALIFERVCSVGIGGICVVYFDSVSNQFVHITLWLTVVGVFKLMLCQGSIFGPLLFLL